MRAACLIFLAYLTGSQASARPVLLELFTSQGCSSCPPADALLGELKQDAGLLPLSLHVTYWNTLGWADPYALSQATRRQRDYSAALLSEVFTPELVIDGKHFAVGSDRAAVLAAIATARQAQRPGPPLSLRASAEGLTASVGGGQGVADLLLIGYDPAHVTQIAAGENGGVTLHETNVVRSLHTIAHWTGAPLQRAIAPLPGEKAALILQAADGTILGIATP